MKKVIYESFESLSEYNRVLNSRETNKVFKNEYLASNDYDFDENCRLMTEGWDAGRNYLVEEELEIASCPMPKMKRERSYFGARVHVGALLAGSEQAFIRRRKRLADSKNILTIYLNTAVLAGVESNEVAEVMGKVFDAILSMENNGYNINLYACCMSKTDKEVGFNVVKIKDSGEELNILRMLYPCINSNFQRAQAFRWRETCPEIKDNDWADGYGSTVRRVDEMREYARHTPADFDAILGYYHCQGMGRQEIVDEIIKQAKEA